VIPSKEASDALHELDNVLENIKTKEELKAFKKTSARKSLPE